MHEGVFGVPDPLVAGLRSTRSKLGTAHPLELSERNVIIIFGLILMMENLKLLKITELQ